MLDRVISSDDNNFGFNAGTEVYGNMVEMGVIDPKKVTRTALENAASVASLLLTTECIISVVNDDNSNSFR